MAKYDQDPAFAGAFPGGPINAHDQMTASGSDGFAVDPLMYQQGGPVLATVPVSHIYDSNAGNVPMVAVHQAATNSAENPMVDPVSKADQTQNPGAGRVVGDHHPGGH